MKYTVLFIVLVLIAAFFAGCTQQAQAPAAPGVIKIGVIASLTGPASNVGKNMWQSASVAADEINAKGGVYVKSLNKNLTIQLVQGDDESTQQGGQKAATKLITDDKVDILVGGYSSAVTSSYEQTIAEYQSPLYRDRCIEPDNHPPHGYRHQLCLPPLPDNRRLWEVYYNLHRPGDSPGSQQKIQLPG